MADCLPKFLNEAKTAEHVTNVLLSDGGKEVNCEAVLKVLEEHGITHRPIEPYTPEQNGAAEQENRTNMESTHFMLHASGCRKNCGLKPVILRYSQPSWNYTSGQ